MIGSSSGLRSGWIRLVFRGRRARVVILGWGRCPPLCGNSQRLQDVVDCGSLGRISIPTTRRKIPQFLGVSAGYNKNRFLRSRALNDVKHCCKTIVLVKRLFVRQNLGRHQCFGQIHTKGCSPHRWSSPSNICPTSL